MDNPLLSGNTEVLSAEEALATGKFQCKLFMPIPSVFGWLCFFLFEQELFTFEHTGSMGSEKRCSLLKIVCIAYILKLPSLPAFNPLALELA